MRIPISLAFRATEYASMPYRPMEASSRASDPKKLASLTTASPAEAGSAGPQPAKELAGGRLETESDANASQGDRKTRRVPRRSEVDSIRHSTSCRTRSHSPGSSFLLRDDTLSFRRRSRRCFLQRYARQGAVSRVNLRNVAKPIITVFAAPTDEELLRIIRSAVSHANIQAHVELLPLLSTADPLSNHRQYSEMIFNSDACIIDVDVMHIIEYAVEFGSLGESLDSLTGGKGPGHGYNPSPAVSRLDSKVLLVTRKPAGHSDVIGWFGKFYSVMWLLEENDDAIRDGLSNWMLETIASGVPKVFISYRASQYHFASRVADSLKRRGAEVWFDGWNIRPGDSIPERINRGLSWCTQMVLVIDDTFFESRWTREELESMQWKYLAWWGRYNYTEDLVRPIIPLFLTDPRSTEMPPMLQKIRGIDCRNTSFVSAMNQLWSAIKQT
jgi:hypothetical protein